MNRRELLLSLTAGALNAQAPAQAHDPQSYAASVYIPKAQRYEDLQLLQDFMEEFAFVELVTTHPELRITHIPVLVDRSAGKYGTIHGHISRQNDQMKAFDGKQKAVIVFRGPQGYISPTWYDTKLAVPTWNFAVVHASGLLNPVTKLVELREFLARLIAKFEKYQSEKNQGAGFDFAKLPNDYVEGLVQGIIGFQMPIELLEGKFKLGQDRSAADRAGILEHLPKARGERSLAEFTASFYRRPS